MPGEVAAFTKADGPGVGDRRMPTNAPTLFVMVSTVKEVIDLTRTL